MNAKRIVSFSEADTTLAVPGVPKYVEAEAEKTVPKNKINVADNREKFMWVMNYLLALILLSGSNPFTPLRER
ncbi:MAG TPA: hypothetical protein VGH05_08855 [Buttiauxella sp.]